MLRHRIISALFVSIVVEVNIAVSAIQEDVVFYNDAVVRSGKSMIRLQYTTVRQKQPR